MNIFPINKEYITTEEAANLLGVSTQAIRKSKDKYDHETRPCSGGYKLYFKTESVINKLNPERRLTIFSEFTPEQLAEKKLLEDGMNIYAALTDAQKKKTGKYLAIFNASSGMSGKELSDFIIEWNKKYPDSKVNLKSYYRNMTKYKDGGSQALIPAYGNNIGSTKIEDEDFDYFCDLYLKEGGPTLKSCWLETYGNYIKRNYGVIPDSYPAMNTFIRQLKRRVPTQSIEIARKGERYWNRTRANYADRDWSNVKAGQCWFSDHRQADQAMLRRLPNDVQKQIERLIKWEGKENSKPVFPWITFWADAKTKKILSILPHMDSPKADHIFLSFHMAADEFGLPDEIYIDNGKDYRCHDFAGGKKKVRVEIDEITTSNLMNSLGIEVHFSKPYRGQSKTIERTFRIMKEWLDKQMPGYRGGNIVERPEKLASEIKNEEIMDFDDYCELLDYFFKNIINKFESQGKILNGKSADQVWAEEFKVLRTTDKESMKLLCMRSSKNYSIDKNGIVVSTKHSLHYWGVWMIPLKGNKQKYYMRRNPKDYSYAWVFNSKTGEYAGKAELNVWKTAALAKIPLEKEQLARVLKAQALEKSIVKSYLPTRQIDPREIIENLAAGIAATSKYTEQENTQITTVFMKTEFDEVQTKQKEYQLTGTHGVDVSKLNQRPKEQRIFSFITDKEEFEKQNADRSHED
jgi:transposase InsO family protein